MHIGSSVAVPEDLESAADSQAPSEAASRRAQTTWASTPIHERLKLLRRARHRMAGRATAFYDAIPPELSRCAADTLVAELLPMLDACRFLERHAARTLRARTPGRHGLPWWMSGLSSKVERVAFGQILIIAPANYPLFLPGVQALQALAAGNSVVWKPGRGGHTVAEVFADAMFEAGLPRELLVVTDDTVDAGRRAIQGAINGIAPSKVVFTGSANTGREILRELAHTATPCVAELSGCDAVVVLPSADVDRVVAAMAFGMRLNGSATCMAPRRLFVVGADPASHESLILRLRQAFAEIAPVQVPLDVADTLHVLLQDAQRRGAVVTGGVAQGTHHAARQVSPALVTDATAAMHITRTDLFAPVLSVIAVPDDAALLHAEAQCSYALTVSIFGATAEARALAAKLTAGTILLNDVIVPTADPRVPFGGRRGSGFGVTRGAEGLLEMTAPRTVIARTGTSLRHYEPTGTQHMRFFEGMILASHAAHWSQRWQGLRSFLSAARNLK